MNTKAIAVAASLWIPMVASAATDASVTEQQEALNERLEQILAKNGISIGGQFRGEIGATVLGGNSQEVTQRDDEQIGYTSVDFDLRARPNTATTARAVFRLHLDHNNFFGSPYTPFETRWLSLDGGAADMLYYHLGSIAQRWTPLTVWGAEPGFLYTPRIFADQQKTAMAERFLGGNVRNLQGFNVGIRAAVPAISIDSFNVSALAGKMLSASPTTGGGLKNPNTTSKCLFGDGVSVCPDSLGNFDRWALGGRGSVTFLKGITLGANFLNIQDLKSTYGTYDAASVVTRNHYTKVDSAKGTARAQTLVIDSLDPLPSKADKHFVMDSLAQNGSLFSFAFGADGAKLMSNKSLILSLDGEFAMSSWVAKTRGDLDVISVTGDTTKTLASGRYNKWVATYSTQTGTIQTIESQNKGNALNATLTGGWATDAWTVKARAGYMQNDSLFRSDLTQSPIFGKARIYNTEQDDAGFSHYNVFDGLYHTVHRWVAEDANQYSKNPYDKIAYTNYAAGPNSPALGVWTKASKSAYTGLTNALLTPADTASISAARTTLYGTVLGTVGDRDLQLVLPAGEASANRVGPKFGLDFDLMQGGVEVKVDGYLLQEAKGSILDSTKQVAADKGKFQQIKAGTRIRADRFISGWTMPIELTASYGLSTAKGGTSLDYTSTALNAGLYAGVYKRIAVLGGFQQVAGKDKATTVDTKQSNIAGGIEFKVQEGATLLAMYNLVQTEFPNATEYNFDQNIWSTKIAVSF